MSSKPIALLVMHYGTPASLEEVPAYYTHIRHGRPPAPEDLEDLVSRYRAIGGPSPLKAISEEQAQCILRGVRKAGIGAKLYIGAKHTHPFIGEAIKQIADDGIDQVVALVLAPHYSTFSVAAYRKYALETRDEIAPNMKIDFVERWGELPALIDALASRVKAQLSGPTGREPLAKGEALVAGAAPATTTEAWNPEETLVIFSAHSLPKRIMAEGDPYVEELLTTSRLVAEKAGVKNWQFAFQSASKTGEPWLTPDILDVIDEEQANYKNFLACTVGFVSDHLEVLYDLGIETRDHCQKLGVNYRRAETIGTDETVMNALAEVCVETLAKFSPALT